MNHFWKKPFGFIKRVVYKTTIGPVKYGKKNDYDASQYWRDRFSKYEFSLRGVGHEGLSEKENKRVYREAARIFTNLCKREKVNFSSADVLDIGCGTGFYTQILQDLGVKKYVGIDITDILFTRLQRKHPHFAFVKKDVTTDKINGQFNLVIMIDVVEHIVNKEKFTFAMENVRQCLSPNGVFIVSPVMDVHQRHLFYARSHSLKDIKKRFPGYLFGKMLRFRHSYILAIKKHSEVYYEKR